MVEPQVAQPAPEENKSWIVLTIVIAVGILVAMLVPAITRQELHPQSLYISVALATLSFTGIWWYRQKNLGIGAGIGAVLGGILYVVAVLVRNSA